MSHRVLQFTEDHIKKRTDKQMDVSAVWDALAVLDKQGIDIGEKAKAQLSKRATINRHKTDS
jgi:hypothetical protein